MSTGNYPANSHKSKEEMRDIENTKPKNDKKKVEKVVTGTVKVKKKNELHKFADIFISEDVKNVKSYVFMDVLVPAIKKAVVDIVTDGVNMIFYGGVRRNNGIGANIPKVPYSSLSIGNYGGVSNNKPLPRKTYDYDNIVLPSRSDAEILLSNMHNHIREYGEVSVGDLYDFVGVTGTYTDYDYGWTDLRNARSVRVRDGYALELPKVSPLN